jgi:hypothetical protein
MAFVPRPVESSSGEKKRPLSSYSANSRTGLVAYQDQEGFPRESLSPDREQGLVNGVPQVTSPAQSPPFLQSFYTPKSDEGSYMYASTPSLKGVSRSPVDMVSGLQPAKTYLRPQRETSHSLRSFHSTTASVHSTWAASTPHIPLPPVLAPGSAPSRNPGAFLGMQGPSPAYSAPSKTWESNVTLKRNFTEPTRTTQRHGVDTQRRSYIPPVAESFWKKKVGDVEVLGQAQWQRLVLTAATKS